MARPESAAAGTLIVLDRDGVLNRLLEKPAEPRPDSPMRPGEVEVFPWVPEVLRELTAAGFGLVIASNQPAHLGIWLFSNATTRTRVKSSSMPWAARSFGSRSSSPTPRSSCAPTSSGRTGNKARLTSSSV